MDPRTWQELEQEFAEEISDGWLVSFQSKSFIEQMIKKAFWYYTSKPEKKPDTREAWKRAISSFCRNNQQQFATNKLSTKPKEMMPFVSNRPKYWTGPEKIEDKLRCDGCDDLRAVRVISRDLSHETLMLCECTRLPDNYDKADWNIPAWDPALNAIYIKEKCPVEWFKPVAYNGSTGDLQDKIQGWRQRVHDAEVWWWKTRDALS